MSPKFLPGLILLLGGLACHESAASPVQDHSDHRSVTPATPQNIPATPQNIPATPQDIALFLCKYSVAVFPNWSQYPKYIDYLSDQEAASIAYIHEELLRETAPFYRARALALDAFVADHPQCTPDPDNPIVSDNTGALLYTMIQTYPIPTPVPDIDLSHDEQERTQRYRAQFESQWNGESKQRKIHIVLEPGGIHGFILRSDTTHSFALPLERQRLWQALESMDFEKTTNLFHQTCARKSPNCAQFAPYFNAAIQGTLYTQHEFNHDVKLTPTDFRLIQLSGNRSVAALKLLADTSKATRTYHHVLMKTQPAPYQNTQFCTLQHARDFSLSSPATLQPNTQQDVWCILSPDTRPGVELHFVTAQ